MKDVTDQILPYLTPSEQAVFIRLWRLTHAEEKSRCALRYEDLARPAHVSLSTLKRVLKKLTHHGLVQVAWQTKRASLFTVSIRTLAPSPVLDLGLSPKLYDYFTEEDRCSSRANGPSPPKAKRLSSRKPAVTRSSPTSSCSAGSLVRIGSGTTKR